jgi:putative transcriptional regulator
MILIAEPFMQDFIFQRAVILLIDHKSRGSMGFILNKQTELVVNDFFADLKSLPAIPIYLGGPISANHLFFVHSLGQNVIPGGVKIGENLYFDGDFGALKSYLLGGNPVYGKVKFLLGYSGWIENQLDGEIAENSWLVSQSSHQSMLMAEDDSYWNRSVEQLGSPYSAWTNFPKDPELN